MVSAVFSPTIVLFLSMAVFYNSSENWTKKFIECCYRNKQKKKNNNLSRPMKQGTDQCTGALSTSKSNLGAYLKVLNSENILIMYSFI